LAHLTDSQVKALQQLMLVLHGSLDLDPPSPVPASSLRVGTPALDSPQPAKTPPGPLDQTSTPKATRSDSLPDDKP